MYKILASGHPLLTRQVDVSALLLMLLLLLLPRCVAVAALEEGYLHLSPSLTLPPCDTRDEVADTKGSC